MKSNIENVFRLSNLNRIFQGDIVKDLTILNYNKVGDEWNIEELFFPYAVILSQDCDLDGDYKKTIELNKNYNISDEEKRKCFNKILKSIFICPAFPAELLRNGEHISNEINNKINSKNWRIVKSNDNPRYHFIEGTEFNNITIPDLALDFKLYFSVPKEYLYNVWENLYLVSLNELFREDLSNRFMSFQSRIGLPVI